MLLRNLNLVYVYTVFVPALCFADLDIVPAHLSLAHAAVIGESPILSPLARCSKRSCLFVQDAWICMQLECSRKSHADARREVARRIACNELHSPPAHSSASTSSHRERPGTHTRIARRSCCPQMRKAPCVACSCALFPTLLSRSQR